MCVANFLCFVCGTIVLGLGVYIMVAFKMTSLIPALASFNSASMLLISGIIITCVSFLGFLGALKENRCLLLTFFILLFLLMLVELAAACMLLMYEDQIALMVKEGLKNGLEKAKTDNSTDVMNDWDLVQKQFKCCGVNNVTDWGSKVPSSCCVEPCNNQMPAYYTKGCVEALKNWFEENFLTTGISVIVLCIVEVLGMCFAMTLFCHISRSGLGYKL